MTTIITYADGSQDIEADDGALRPVGLRIDRWTIPADNGTYAVARYGADEPVWVVVDGVPNLIVPVDGVATVNVAADTPGPVRIEVRDSAAVIVSEEV